MQSHWWDRPVRNGDCIRHPGLRSGVQSGFLVGQAFCLSLNDGQSRVLRGTVPPKKEWLRAAPSQ